MKISVIAKLDKSGSEATRTFHYTFGSRKDPVSGGFYIDKAMEYPPDEIHIEISRKEE